MIQSGYSALRQISRFRVGWRRVLRNEAEFREGCGGLLRNEATGAAAMFLLKAAQFVERFIEGALVGGLVAEEEGEPFFIDSSIREAGVLQAEGALFEPVGLGHLADQELFG